jgi:hypothetical protein
VPLLLTLPPDLAEGRYSLLAAFVDPVTGDKSVPAKLDEVQIVRRAVSYVPPTLEHVMNPAPTFGTHASLAGYEFSREATALKLQLTWQVTQPLLPPHHIFVHLYNASGARIAQNDGEPVTFDRRAPTGSWLPGEYITTTHTLHLPDAAPAPFTVQLGLYLPQSGQRLPVTLNGTVIGDSATISVPVAP